MFDKTEIYEAEIEPLINAFHAKCKEHGIAFVAAAAYAKDENEEFAVHLCNFFNGEETTPVPFVAAKVCLQGDLEQAIGVMLHLMRQQSSTPI